MISDTQLMKEAVNTAGEHRRYLHTIPEAAFEEKKTTEYIRKICGSYPVEIIDLGMETGLLCWLDAGADETVALRADIDALPTEQGTSHLCGHDAHASSLLGAMHYLCGTAQRKLSDNPPLDSAPADHAAFHRALPNNVLFIFQPAEEGTRGAKAMLEHGLLSKVPKKPDRIFGIHNRPEVDCGKVVVHKGPLMSEKSVFTITYTGVPGHASLPHKCIDPLVAACSFVGGMQTVVSRNADPFKPVICTVNSLTAGRAEVPSPETAVMTGYIRSFDHETHVRMESRVRRLALSTAEAYECRSDINITRAVPAVYNSEEMFQKAYCAAEKAVGKDRIVDSEPCLASEDFAVFGEKIPSFFYWVGSGTPGKTCAPWHDPAFCIDPDYFETAVPLLCAAALE